MMDVGTLRALARNMEQESDEPGDIRGLRARAVAWAADEIERLQNELSIFREAAQKASKMVAEMRRPVS